MSGAERPVVCGVWLQARHDAPGGRGAAAMAKAAQFLRELKPPMPPSLCLQAGRQDGIAVAWRLHWLRMHEDEEQAWACRLGQALAAHGLQAGATEVRQEPSLCAGEAPGVDLCLELTSPLVLPCSRLQFDLDALYTTLRARLRQLGGRQQRATMRALQEEQKSLRKRSPAPKLLTHLVRHWPPQPVDLPADDLEGGGPPPGPWGLGRHGHCRGSVFLRHPPPVLQAALQQLQPLNGLALARRARATALVTEGAYRLRWQVAPWLDQALLHRRRLLSLVRQHCQATDSPTLSDETGRLLNAEQVADKLLQQAVRTNWTWEPNELHLLARPDQAPRPIEVLSPMHSLWQRHVHRVLSKAWEPLFQPNSYGFRAGLGAHAATDAVRDALGRGFTHVLRTDIAQCFDSVPHELMLAAVDAALPGSDRTARAAIRAALGQPHTHQQEVRARHHGLVQGAPLSPLLLNLYLTPLDRRLAAMGVFSLRYADDILVLGRSREQVRGALNAIHEELAKLGLKTSDHKTTLQHVQQGFDFLGQRFGLHRTEQELNATPAQRKPLVVSWPWLQLGVNGASIEAKRDGQIVGRWPLRRLSALVLLSPANVSTTLIERCLKQDVTLGLTLQSGRQHLVMPPMGRHSYERAHQHARWHGSLDETQRLAIAQSLVDAKLHNMGVVVAQREPRSTLRRQLRDIQLQLAGTADLNTLRGHEGYAARLTFRWLNEQIRAPLQPHFCAARRLRGAPDRLNSLLNLGYYFLAARMRAWVRLQALNPYLAWLHDADDPYETLVYDLMEPFRPFVDRLVLRHINRQEVRPDHFADVPGQHRMVPEAAARFAQSFEAALGERVGAHLLRDLLWLQARAVRLAVQQRGPLWVFRWQPKAPESRDTPPAEPLLWMAEDGDAWGDATPLANAPAGPVA